MTVETVQNKILNQYNNKRYETLPVNTATFYTDNDNLKQRRNVAHCVPAFHSATWNKEKLAANCKLRMDML